MFGDVFLFSVGFDGCVVRWCDDGWLDWERFFVAVWCAVRCCVRAGGFGVVVFVTVGLVFVGGRSCFGACFVAAVVAGAVVGFVVVDGWVAACW